MLFFYFTQRNNFWFSPTGQIDQWNSVIRPLTPEYYITRYPDATEDLPSKLYTEEDARRYIKNCEELLKWAKSKLNL